jgi:hypothetical protein
MYSVPFFLAVVGGTTLKCYVAILKGLNKILRLILKHYACDNLERASVQKSYGACGLQIEA